jgi:hypothetical protein
VSILFFNRIFLFDRIFRHAFLAALLTAAVATPSLADHRVALVIGNSAYKNAPYLPNPINDAADVAAALKRSGFETILATDVDKTGMDEATIKFARSARDADVALFYYSGHAIQFAGVNYLAPTDTKLSDEADLRRMVRVDEIVADLQQSKTLRILILDSCRDNPLAEQLKRSIGATRALPLQRGLAKIDSPQGMIVAYSTQAGRTADDGDGRNSPYTRAFLGNIEQQEEIGTIFRRISSDVYETTKHQQLPELSLSLIGEFYLRGKVEVSLSPANVSPQKEAPAESNLIPGFDGLINPPESETYFVIHDNVIARAGASEKEEGLFRLPLREKLQSKAEYEIQSNDYTTLPDRTWVKFATTSGQVGFLQKRHLLAPKQFKRWEEILAPLQSIDEQFKRSKGTSGPFASFSGVYCGGGDDCGIPPNMPSLIFPKLVGRFLIWFEGSTIHLVNLFSGRESVGPLQPDKLISFSGSEQPWQGVKKLPSYKVSYQPGKVEVYAFTKTHVFYQKTDSTSFGYLVRAKNDMYERTQLLTQYLPDVAEYLGRGTKISSTRE